MPFEDRIFVTEGPSELLSKILEAQARVKVIQKALTEIAREEQVRTGQLKNVTGRLKVIGQNLYFMTRVVVPNELRHEAVLHTPAQHHFGQAGTTRSLRRNFFWPRMVREVRSFCHNCITCQRSSGREPMCMMEIGEGTPSGAMSMDIGTLPWADDPEDGFRYFRLMVDLFTRYVELQPLRDQEANTLLAAFQQGWVYRGHGMPSIVLTDKGSNVDGKVFREFCAKAGIKKRSMTPYHPQGEGMVERNIGFVKKVIQCIQADRQLTKGSWPMLLTEVSFHINRMENATTRFSPHLLHFRREPSSPLDTWCNNLREGERDSHGEYLEALKKKRVELQVIAKENTRENLSRARMRYNLNKKGSDIERGDWVMLKENKRRDHCQQGLVDRLKLWKERDQILSYS